MTMTGMTTWAHVSHLVFTFALGAASSTLLWGIVLGFSPRRRGRHEATPPELEPTTSATGVLHAITQPVQPPLPRRGDPPSWPRVDQDRWWVP